MHESSSDQEEKPTWSPVRFRVQVRNRKGMQGREAMFVCQNFHVNRTGCITYTNLNGLFMRVTLEPGDYFDVKVMAG